MSEFKLGIEPKIYRGDTIKLRVPVTRDGVAVNITTATFRLTAKRWLNDTTPLIQKDNTAFTSAVPASGVTIATIDPADTIDFEDTTIIHVDVEMTEDDDRVTTVAKGTIIVSADVST